jgi:hypothetical protein
MICPANSLSRPDDFGTVRFTGESLLVTRDGRLSGFSVSGTPDVDKRMEVLCEDNSGTYTLPFACQWTDGIWLNCSKRVAIEGRVVGWRSWEWPKHR